MAWCVKCAFGYVQLPFCRATGLPSTISENDFFEIISRRGCALAVCVWTSACNTSQCWAADQRIEPYGRLTVYEISSACRQASATWAFDELPALSERNHWTNLKCYRNSHSKYSRKKLFFFITNSCPIRLQIDFLNSRRRFQFKKYSLTFSRSSMWLTERIGKKSKSSKLWPHSVACIDECWWNSMLAKAIAHEHKSRVKRMKLREKKKHWKSFLEEKKNNRKISSPLKLAAVCLIFRSAFSANLLRSHPKALTISKRRRKKTEIEDSEKTRVNEKELSSELAAAIRSYATYDWSQ